MCVCEREFVCERERKSEGKSWVSVSECVCMCDSVSV